MKKLRIAHEGREIEGGYLVDGRFLEVSSSFGKARVVLGLSKPDKLARALIKSMIERGGKAPLK